MKSISTIIMSLFLIGSGLQAQSGKITYEEKIKFEIELGPEMAQFADMIPTENVTQMDLFYSPEASLYKKAPEKPKEGVEDMEVETFSIMIGGGPGVESYRSFKSGACVKSENLMGKAFLVEGDCTSMAWKIESEQKKISGYNCIKATVELDSAQVATAWFTPEIPLPLGPGEFYGLPGAIIHLSLDTEGAPITYAAVEIETGDFSDEIKVPTKGKKVTPEEYEKIVRERMEEMEAMMGGEESSISGDGNNVEIKIISRN